jgi:hypothetical protein
MPEIESTSEVSYLIRIVNDVTAKAEWGIGLHPGSTVKYAPDSTGLEFQLARNGEYPARSLYVTLDLFTADGSLYRKAKGELRSAILEFWSPGNGDPVGRVRIEC